MATDAGFIGIFGIRQERNQDNPLFYRIRRDVPLADEEATAKEEGSTSFRPERSQVVHAQENAFWALTQGHLRKYLLTTNDAKGPRLVEQWRQSLLLGSPLHGSQIWRQAVAGVSGQGPAASDEGEEIL